MKAGVVVPQGWMGEYAGWEPTQAWRRTVEVARQAEALGFESIWLFDHFTTTPEPIEALTFEAFTTLSALAANTSTIRLGHVVVCSGFRNPALVAKMAGTLDTISAGRFELGLGAGWKRDEWVAYGYGFPSLHDRLETLRDTLEIVTRMLTPGELATYKGEHARVAEAINLPVGVQQPRIPILVGGNGPEVTWRLAARYADELNLDGPEPDEVEAMLPVIRSRCEEIGREPATLRVSVHMWSEAASQGGPARVDRLAAYRRLGISRVTGFIGATATSDEALEAFAEDAIAAGAAMASDEFGKDALGSSDTQR